MAEETKYYNIPVLPRVVSDKELTALAGMFAHPGWSVLMQLRKLQANASKDIGMSLVAEETDRQQHRALYHSYVSDLTLEDSINKATADTGSMTAKELDECGYKEEDFEDLEF